MANIPISKQVDNMKQVLQNIGNGETSLQDIPCPKIKSGYLLIASKKSLISVGTERMLVDFGKSNLLRKATSQPDKVAEVINKVKTDGISATYDAVKSKLDHPMPLGYCNVGSVIDGSDTGISPGMRVVSNGPHAEVVRVPKNLICPIPTNVDDETASFTIMGAIAMQGIRLINPTIGETVVVTGLGLIGLLSVQILKANGCRVIGIDFDSTKCKLAKSFGAEVVNLSRGEDPIITAAALTQSRGVDAVLITASSSSNSVVHQSAAMCRKRGRIVLIGVVGLDLNRADFYEKELSFQVSCSYGPGRYDEEYEDQGNDYPIGFVRWTEQRNFEAVLELMNVGSINIKSLVSHRFSIDDAKLAYQKLDDKTSLGILLNYSNSVNKDIIKSTVEFKDPITSIMPVKGHVAFIGGGNYASRILIPAFKAAGATLTTLVTSGGVSAVHHGKKNSFSKASTDINEALKDETDSIVIATQHNFHATQCIAALEKGTHVFVEKPLATSLAEAQRVVASIR